MEERVESKPPTKAIIGLVAAVLLVIATTAVVIAMGNTDGSRSSEQTASTSVSPSASVAASPSAANGYKAGTYSATGRYNSPGGQESIKISVTLGADGTISDTSATSGAVDGEGQEYQGQFISAYKSQVVGKKISEVNLSRVAGSSLTSIGFNNAIDQIETEAAS